MKNLKTIFSLLVILVTSAAHADLSGSALVPKEEMNFAKSYLAEIRERDFEYVLSHIDPELSGQVSEEKLEEVAAYFPSGQLLSTELIGSQVNTLNETWQGNFSFEYEFESGWAVANVVMKRIGKETTVIGFNVYRTEASQKELNKFVLAGKSVLHYLVLVLACIIPIFILVTLVYCIKTPIEKRKWLWVLFILGGIGTITINWSTGAFGFKILQYQLFGAAAAAASEYAPWVITAGFPLGAIIFWFKRKSFIEQSKANKSSQQDASEAGASA
jgi:hypothetical protein